MLKYNLQRAILSDATFLQQAASAACVNASFAVGSTAYSYSSLSLCSVRPYFQLFITLPKTFVLIFHYEIGSVSFSLPVMSDDFSVCIWKS